MFNKKILKQTGQGLIEATASIAIIAMGMSAIISLVIMSLASDKENSNRMIATNLLREGIEVARNQRDSNWLRIDSGVVGAAWDDGLYNNKDYTVIINFDESTGDWDFQFQPNIISSPYCKMYLKNEVYEQRNGVVPGGIPTNFYRLIKLYPICELDGVETIAEDGQVCNDVAPGSDKIGIQVISEVIWGDGKSVLARDKLYNWK
ncbi:MAG: hypothetical protein U9O55_00505 [Patescibacteria group bacterium]|nr:hypothetical protein [Patescibacteria group bacterium]